MDTNHIKQHLADLYAQAMLEELFGLQDELDRIEQELDDWAGKSLIDNGDEDEISWDWEAELSSLPDC